MYRIVFVSENRSFVAVKNLVRPGYYAFNQARLSCRFDHWAQCDSFLRKAYAEGSAEKLIFEKISYDARMELLHEILQQAYSKGYYEPPSKVFESLQAVWSWVYEENERVSEASRHSPRSVSMHIKQKRLASFGLERLLQQF